jgi:hypothetical protein
MVIRKKKRSKYQCQYCEYKCKDMNILKHHEVTIHGYHRDAPFRKKVYYQKKLSPPKDMREVPGTMKSKDGFDVPIIYKWNQTAEMYDIYTDIGGKRLKAIYSDDIAMYKVPDWSGAKAEMIKYEENLRESDE